MGQSGLVVRAVPSLERLEKEQMMSKEEKGVISVDVIASGYEWNCPICGMLNTQAGYMEIVTCENEKCGCSHPANLPEHCFE